MNGKEISSILFTFIVGFCVGVYFYFSGFMQSHDAPDVRTQEEFSEFTLVAEVYGGCRNTCPSFQILKDGSYRYLFTPGVGEDQIIREGTLPRELRKAITSTFVPQTLIDQSRIIKPSMCNSYVDGIDVRYEITIDTTEYKLDTCGTDMDTESPFWNTLVKIWNYFETGDV